MMMLSSPVYLEGIFLWTDSDEILTSFRFTPDFDLAQSDKQ